MAGSASHLEPDDEPCLRGRPAGKQRAEVATRTARSAVSIFDGSGAEVVARGVRHSVGFNWNPMNKQLYFSDEIPGGYPRTFRKTSSTASPK